MIHEHILQCNVSFLGFNDNQHFKLLQRYMLPLPDTNEQSSRIAIAIKFNYQFVNSARMLTRRVG